MTAISEIVKYAKGAYDHMDGQKDWMHPTEINVANNVKLALGGMGFDVCLGDAKFIWELYSESNQAGWMMGGNTVTEASDVLKCFFASIDFGDITKVDLDIEITWPQ